MHLACSEDSLVEFSNATYLALKDKVSTADSAIPPPPDVISLSFTVSGADVAQAIKLFPSGSSGGPDGLLPQHLKDMMKCHDGDVSPFLSVLTPFATLVWRVGHPLLSTYSCFMLP